MKKKGRKRKILLLVILILVALSILSNIRIYKPLTWPKSDLGRQLPTMHCLGKVEFENDRKLNIEIHTGSEKTYQKYLSKCKDFGYTIEAEEGSDSYEAFNEAGYSIELRFYQSLKDLDVTVNAPKEGEKLNWPFNELSGLLPVPKSDKGEISTDKSDYLFVYVYDISVDDFADYVNECQQMGYSIDYDKGKTWFSGYNDEGYYTHISYQGLREMTIELTTYGYQFDHGYEERSEEELFGHPLDRRTAAKTQQSEETTAEETTTEETTTTTEATTTTTTEKATTTTTEANAASKDDKPQAGVSPDFKQIMDGYEKFFDDYVDFLNRYQKADSASQMSMLFEYTTMLTDYAEAMEGLDSIDSDSLSEADLAYYIEVTARIEKKLLEAY